MSSTKISIHAGQPIEAALNALGLGGHANKSGRLNTVCERYLAMVADELGRLDISYNEWCAIMDANNGVQPFVGHPEIHLMLSANIADTPSLGAKWDIDQPALVRKLQALPKSSLVAIQEACDRRWSRSDLDTELAMCEAGIPVHEASEVGR